MKIKLTSLLILTLLAGCSPMSESNDWNDSSTSTGSRNESAVTSIEESKPLTATIVSDMPTIDMLPIDDGYIELNGNIPTFTNEELSETEPYTYYSPFDELGRTQMAIGLLDTTLMPDIDRKDSKSISNIYPTGWNQGSYDFINSGGWLYNRSHLIGYQLVGDNSAENLMTGTREFNADLMLPFENFVADYIETTDEPVLFRVTPIYNDDDLLAYGLQMEGYSTTDDGESVQYNIFVPNQQKGIEIDYQTGNHKPN